LVVSVDVSVACAIDEVFDVMKSPLACEMDWTGEVDDLETVECPYACEMGWTLEVNCFDDV
jgi:hypothetical protein